VTADDVEWTLGVLLAAGHDPDHLLTTYSFDQLALFARCTLGHHVRVLNMLLSPMLGSQGMEWTDHKVPRSQAGQKKRTDAEEAKRESRLLQKLAASPFGVRTAQTSSTGAPLGPDG